MNLRQVVLKVIIGASLLLFTNIPAKATDKKRVHIDLTNQKLYAYEDNNLMFAFTISTGKTATPTPIGGFWPWIKLRYDRMQGGSWARGDYYDLPNVPYVIYFYNENYSKWKGYAIHGTYWHNNFGYPMSHGCVNLKAPDIAQLYPWISLPTETERGTLIIITGQTPPS